MNQEIDKNTSKEELEKLMNDRNREQLSDISGIGALLKYNLENFAYRYLETSTVKNIKCQIDGNDYFVTSVEEDILQALKWENKALKAELIKLCKLHPGTKSKNLKVQLKLGSLILNDNLVECYAVVNWNQDNFKEDLENRIEKRVSIRFDDPLELRNTHAKFLEEVCEIF